MFFPFGDAPNPRGFRPWVNWALIAANLAVYFLISLPLSLQPADFSDPHTHEYVSYLRQVMPGLDWYNVHFLGISAYDVFVFVHGYQPGQPEWLDLFTAMFLHGGFMHLAGNMLFLWIFGDNVEHRLGRFLYLLLYLATGVGATLAFALFAGDSLTPLVGASGAISGVLGLYFLLFPRNRVKVFAFLFPFYYGSLMLPARWVLGFYVLVDNLLPFLMGAQSGVAYGAHLGGFLAGLGAAYLGELVDWRLPRRGMKSGRRPREEAVLERLRQAISSNNQQAALQEVGNLTRDQMARLEPTECVQLADWLERTGNIEAASQVLRRCLASHAGSQDLARVFLALGLARLRQGQPAAAYQHLLSVFDFNPDEQTAEEARQALELISNWRYRP